MYDKKLIDLYLNNGFDFSTAKNEIDFVFDILFDYRYGDYLMGKTLNEEQKACIFKIITERVTTRKPIQQLTGMAFFFGRKFYVSEHTLIPRIDTEILVNGTLTCVKKITADKILDIGTGSGCIPVTLALETKETLFDAVDISPEALTVAQKNAGFHKVSERINFIKSDLFENIKEKYDIIVSNPPYIPIKDKETLQIEVKDHDPALALFAYDEKGTDFYEKISSDARDFLNPKGVLLYEIGINQCEIIKDILKKYGFKNICSIRDLNGIERVVCASA